MNSRPVPVSILLTRSFLISGVTDGPNDRPSLPVNRDSNWENLE
jgi:hypothetical protein